MKKIIAAIFAHPDDEAFGPSGTLAKYALDNDVYLIAITKGESGENYIKESKEPIEKIRERELLCSAKKLGIKKVFFLGFKDGTLCNNLYHQIADKMMKILDKLKPEILITVEHRGVSGHIDHIVASMVTSYVFNRLESAKKIMYHCVIEKYRKLMPADYFIYIPPGYKESEIDEVVDVSSVWKKKINAIMCHQSQLKDIKRTLNRLQQFPKEEYFLVVTK